jgi:hypothetical protein
MLWWMWIVLWVAVVAVSVIFLVVVGFKVFRRGVRTLGEFGEAMDRLEVNVGRGDNDGGPAGVRAGGVPGITVPAVFSAPEDVRAAARAAQAERRLGRRTVRVMKRSRRGQPQLLKDLPHL